MTRLGKEIAKRRAKLKLSLRAVGERAGVSYQAVVLAERGRVKLATALKIAKAVRIPAKTAFQLAVADLKRDSA